MRARESYAFELRRSKKKEILSKKRDQMHQKVKRDDFFKIASTEGDSRFIRIKDSETNMKKIAVNVQSLGAHVLQDQEPGIF